MDPNIANKQASSSPRLWNSKGPHICSSSESQKMDLYQAAIMGDSQRSGMDHFSGQEKIWGVSQSKYRTYENLGERTMWTEYVGYKVSWGEMEGVTWTF